MDVLRGNDAMRRLAFFTKDRSFNTRKLREKLGYTMRHTNEEGLIETTRWYCAHLARLPAKVGLAPRAVHSQIRKG